LQIKMKMKLKTVLGGGTGLLAIAAIAPMFTKDEDFKKKVRLSFPHYMEQGTADSKVVHVVSRNQLEYLIKTCSEFNKTLCPS
jgi:hypothetical protein